MKHFTTNRALSSLYIANRCYNLLSFLVPHHKRKSITLFSKCNQLILTTLPAMNRHLQSKSEKKGTLWSSQFSETLVFFNIPVSFQEWARQEVRHFMSLQDNIMQFWSNKEFISDPIVESSFAFSPESLISSDVTLYN